MGTGEPGTRKPAWQAIQLAQALVGRVKERHRFLLIRQLTLMDVLDEHFTELDREIAARIGPIEQEPRREPTEEAPQQEISGLVSANSAPSREQSAFAQASEPGLEGYAQALARLDMIPGVNRRIAEIVLAEIGINMRFFPSAGHLASWAGMCPGSKVSAGKRLSGKTSKGSLWLRAALIEAAHAAARRKDTYLGEQYRRLAKRIGMKKAIIAVAHTILVIIYLMLKEERSYQELGSTYFQEREREAVKLRAVRSLLQLGYHVSLQEADDAA